MMHLTERKKALETIPVDEGAMMTESAAVPIIVVLQGDMMTIVERAGTMRGEEALIDGGVMMMRGMGEREALGECAAIEGTSMIGGARQLGMTALTNMTRSDAEGLEKD